MPQPNQGHPNTVAAAGHTLSNAACAETQHTISGRVMPLARPHSRYASAARSTASVPPDASVPQEFSSPFTMEQHMRTTSASKRRTAGNKPGTDNSARQRQGVRRRQQADSKPWHEPRNEPGYSALEQLKISNAFVCNRVRSLSARTRQGATSSIHSQQHTTVDRPRQRFPSVSKSPGTARTHCRGGRCHPCPCPP